VHLATPQMGETVDLTQPQKGNKWWLAMLEEEMAR